MPTSSIGYAARSATSPLTPLTYELRDLESSDILIEVHFCGICHSDIHAARSEWGPSIYPLVPGHEFTGVVMGHGASVQKFAVGDRVGVGCRVGSCGTCKQCEVGCEQYCLKAIRTYNGRMPDGSPTHGGYGKFVVVTEHFVLRIPECLPMDKAAPLLCAGITMYSPMKYNNIQRGGLRIGVIGLGGLGHMAVQLAAAWGNDVTVITRTAGKSKVAQELGAKRVILSSDSEQMEAAFRSFDYLFDTVSAPKDVGVLLSLLDVNGVMVTVGLPSAGYSLEVNPGSLIAHRRSIQGSVIGGIKETDEMLQFCAERKILPYIELVRCDQINEAYERVLKSDVKFRFVIDVKNTQAEQ